MSTKVITLSGHMGSGKDTAANYMKELVPGTNAYAFAEHLKRIASEIFGLSDEQIYGDLKEVPFENPIVHSSTFAEQIHAWVCEQTDEYGDDEREASIELASNHKEFETPRQLLQYLGTEILRDCYDKNYHINQVARKIEAERPRIAVITDARFLNEREWAIGTGATTVLITGRTREDFNKRDFKKHASENGLGVPEDYDVHIDNSGTLFELKENIVSLVQGL